MSQTGPDCSKCGQTHPNCTAHNRQGQPCGRQPVAYQSVCDMHGGASPRALRAAAKREASALIAQAYDADPQAVLAAQGLEPISDPLDALGRVAAASEHLLDALGARVNALPDIINVDAKGTEEISAIFRAYERAMDRHARLADLLVRAGFDERKIKLEEGTAVAFTSVMRAVLDRLDLTPAQREIVPGIVVEELGKLEG